MYVITATLQQGITTSIRGAGVYDFEHGKIRRAHVFADRAEALEAVGLSEWAELTASGPERGGVWMAATIHILRRAEFGPLDHQCCRREAGQPNRPDWSSIVKDEQRRQPDERDHPPARSGAAEG